MSSSFPEQPTNGPQASASGEPSKRVYFALWPDETMQRALAEATRAVVRSANGRAVPPRNFHVTLAFLGSVPERRLPELEAVAQGVARSHGAPGIDLTLDRLEHWRKPGILCAAPSESSRTGAELADALRRALAAAGFAPDLKPFHPHVTLARKVSRVSGELNMTSVAWKFDAFGLIESRTEPGGAIYSVVSSWRLDGSEKPLKK